ncbi:hypothetical protein JCM9533A_84000 [Catenuloplanes niger JCM 9533]
MFGQVREEPALPSSRVHRVLRIVMTHESAWPLESLSALRLGKRLAVEVPPTGPGRRAFVDITPGSVDADAQARAERWTHRSTARSFTVQHWEYDAAAIDGLDYDIAAVCLRSATAADESELLTVLRKWHRDPTHFRYVWDTADPR